MSPRTPAPVPDRSLASLRAPATRRRARPRWRGQLGGVEGNDLLTGTTAVVLIGLLFTEGVTVVHMRGLVSAHMFIGLVLVPPVLLKLGSTGYRFLRYYAGAAAYRAKGPPWLPLRLMAPVLVVSTIVLFGSGVALLLSGHRSGGLLTIHQASFVVWVAVFGVHVVAYLPRAVRSTLGGWGPARRDAIAGAGWRATLLAGSVGGGAALALALLTTIAGWHGGGHG
ncbi:MAG: hypothetical protein QOG77_2919 [Solirubrobacteraceae bacterium]|nr:hypothetical protein [Solirubrobacteraceae bacterium]